MQTFSNIEDILEFALDFEKKSQEYYADLSQKYEDNDLKAFFLQLADFESQHYKKLLLIKSNKIGKLHFSKFNLLNSDAFADLGESCPIESPHLQKAILWAIDREKVAMNYYQSLSETTEERELKNFFQELAEEEKSHMQSLRDKLKELFS